MIVDYRRLLKMFKLLEADCVVATSVVGSLSTDYKPGEYVVLDQFIDMTKNNPHTVYDEKAFCFVDFTTPYCENIRSTLIAACEELKISYHKTGCYVGVDGPRYETAAEVKAFGLLGGDVVGMTNVTEAIMARELGMCYGSVAIISNYGAGIADRAILREDCYNKTMEVLDNTIAVIKKFVEIIEEYNECECHTKNADMLYTNL
ncbi:MAG: S-methyl-5'-thioadenosine phosphorylase [Lachnospiraceae bacterium]|nr:S-methyl-5'-thioadenosine phosphorylase [Lachnospiraceae bacterium]